MKNEFTKKEISSAVKATISIIGLIALVPIVIWGVYSAYTWANDHAMTCVAAIVALWLTVIIAKIWTYLYHGFKGDNHE